MTAIPQKRRKDDTEKPEHVSSDWVLRVIGEMLKEFIDNKNCTNDCPAMRELQQKVKDNEKSLDLAWKKIDWILFTSILTLLSVIFKILFK